MLVWLTPPSLVLWSLTPPSLVLLSLTPPPNQYKADNRIGLCPNSILAR
jgi:hypothetical protein